MLDGITESPVIPLRDYNLELLCQRHDGSCGERLAGVHMQRNEGDYRVSGTNKADSQVPTCPVGTQKTVEVAWLSCPSVLLVMIYNDSQETNGCGLVPGQRPDL